MDYPLSLETIFTYDGEGNKLGETNWRVLPTRFEYDNLGRLTRTEIDQPITGGATLTLSEVTYLDAVRKRTERDARGNSTTFEMDEQGRVTKITDALTQEQIFEYDAVNKTAEQDKRNLRNTNQTQFTYDGAKPPHHPHRRLPNRPTNPNQLPIRPRRKPVGRKRRMTHRPPLRHQEHLR